MTQRFVLAIQTRMILCISLRPIFIPATFKAMERGKAQLLLGRTRIRITNMALGMVKLLQLSLRSDFDVRAQDPNTCPSSNLFRAPPTISGSFILNRPFPQMVCLNLCLHLLRVRL